AILLFYVTHVFISDFTIVKHIKKNQCTCSCKCIPDRSNNFQPIASEQIFGQNQRPKEVKAASEESEIAEISSGNGSKEAEAISSSHESIHWDDKATTERDSKESQTTVSYHDGTQSEEKYAVIRATEETPSETIIEENTINTESPGEHNMIKKTESLTTTDFTNFTATEWQTEDSTTTTTTT
ncbi:hypothetical protein Tcan_00577, partial [Toxocara canis]